VVVRFVNIVDHHCLSCVNWVAKNEDFKTTEFNIDIFGLDNILTNTDERND